MMKLSKSAQNSCNVIIIILYVHTQTLFKALIKAQATEVPKPYSVVQHQEVISAGTGTSLLCMEQ